MGSREDDAYWNTKYAEASCLYHGDDDMYYYEDAGEWVCGVCDNGEDDARTYYYG